MAVLWSDRRQHGNYPRQADFKNVTYPLSGHLLGHGSLEWLDTPANPATKQRTIHLVDGSTSRKSLAQWGTAKNMAIRRVHVRVGELRRPHGRRQRGGDHRPHVPHGRK